jgi:hypothetical protein
MAYREALRRERLTEAIVQECRRVAVDEMRFRTIVEAGEMRDFGRLCAGVRRLALYAAIGTADTTIGVEESESRARAEIAAQLEPAAFAAIAALVDVSRLQAYEAFEARLTSYPVALAALLEREDLALCDIFQAQYVEHAAIVAAITEHAGKVLLRGQWRIGRREECERRWATEEAEAADFAALFADCGEVPGVGPEAQRPLPLTDANILRCFRERAAPRAPAAAAAAAGDPMRLVRKYAARVQRVELGEREASCRAGIASDEARVAAGELEREHERIVNAAAEQRERQLRSRRRAESAKFASSFATPLALDSAASSDEAPTLPSVPLTAPCLAAQDDEPRAEPASSSPPNSVAPHDEPPQLISCARDDDDDDNVIVVVGATCVSHAATPAGLLLRRDLVADEAALASIADARRRIEAAWASLADR